MVTKPISQNVTVSAEDGSVRLLVNPDGSINVNTGGGTTADVNLSEVGGAAVALGQAAMAASLPVTIASNQSALPNNITQVGGNTLAADDAAAGTTVPVPVGGIFQTTLPTYTNLDRTQAQFTSRGGLLASVVGVGSTGADAFLNSSTTYFGSEASPGTNPRLLITGGSVFNGTSWDRLRGNTTGAIVIPPQGWSYAAATGGIVNTTTAVTIKGAAGAGIRNYLSGLTLSTDALGAATELAVRDGAGGTVLWRGRLQTTAMNATNIQFPTPLFSTANTLLEVVTLTAVTGGVYVDATGYTAP